MEHELMKNEVQKANDEKYKDKSHVWIASNGGKKKLLNLETFTSPS